jgi:hypothetical protein
MKCEEVKYYLNDYAEGFLIDEMRAEIKNHIEYCKECKHHYIDEISVLREVCSFPREATSSRDILREINNIIEAGKRKKTSRILSINHLDIYPGGNEKSKKLSIKKQNKNSGWFAFGAALLAIILGVVLGIFYFFQ